VAKLALRQPDLTVEAVGHQNFRARGSAVRSSASRASNMTLSGS
jgi:hypothetical protein